MAGTVAAIALSRSGADVTIYEAHEQDGTGSFVSLAVNGLRALDAIGAGRRVRAAGFPVACQRLWSSAGGREERGDLIVGADGIWSATRRSLIPGGPEPTYTGISVLSGRSRGVDLEGGVFNLVFGRNGVFLHVTDPAGETWWQAQVVDPVPPARDREPDPAWLARWAEHERGASAIIAATKKWCRPSVNHALKPPKTWAYGRAVLIGDAAHPVGAGQGASMAIEDGLELAAALADEPSIEEGLRRYERARRPRIAKMHKAAQDNRELKKAGPIRRRLEEVMMPIVVPRVFERATGWLYDYTPPTSSLTSRSMSSPSCQRSSAPRS